MSQTIQGQIMFWCLVIFITQSTNGYAASSYQNNRGFDTQPNFQNNLQPQIPGIAFPIAPSAGPCPTTPIFENFELERYLGRWFEIERFFAPFQNGDCVTADYGKNPNCSISVINSNVVDGQLDTITGYAVSGPDPTRGELIVVFPNQPSVVPIEEPNYGVVATDYQNYAVVYSCTDIAPGVRFEYSWILGRKPTMNPKFLSQLKLWLREVGVESDRYMPTNQQNCLRRQLMQY